MQGSQEVLLTTAAPALVADVLRRFGSAQLRVAGASMLPAIRPRDVLFVERRAIQQIQIGDIVLFALDDRLFANRVVRKDVDETGAPTLVTRGDTHRDEDLPIESSQLLGQVLTVSRNGRTHAAPFPYSWAASLLSRAAAWCLQPNRRARTPQ